MNADQKFAAILVGFLAFLIGLVVGARIHVAPPAQTVTSTQIIERTFRGTTTCSASQCPIMTVTTRTLP